MGLILGTSFIGEMLYSSLPGMGEADIHRGLLLGVCLGEGDICCESSCISYCTNTGSMTDNTFVLDSYSFIGRVKFSKVSS